MSSQPKQSALGGFWLSKFKGRPNWYITCYDAASEQTKRVTTGTSDLLEAEGVLAAHVVLKSQFRNVAPAEMPLSTVFVRYWEQHAKALPSQDTAKHALGLWTAQWGEAVVSDLTVEKQEEFIAWLKGRGYKNSYVSRVIGVGRAAIKRAFKRQEITYAPFILDVTDREDEEDYPLISKADMRKLIMTARDTQPHVYFFIMACLNTLARPDAVMELTPEACDLQYRRIDLNPKGRKRTKKGRPVVPITTTFMPFIAAGVQYYGHAPEDPKRVPSTFVNWNGKAVKCVKKAFAAVVKAAGLSPEITPYCLRHTMATELRARNVPWEELKGLLGHKMKGVTEKYARFDPNYMSLGSRAIDAYFEELSVALPLLVHNKVDDTEVSKALQNKEGIGAGEEDRTLDIHLGKVCLPK